MKKILAGLLIGAMLAVPAYADFDYSVFDGLSKEELETVRDELDKRIDGYMSSEDAAEVSSGDLIEFTEADDFLSLKNNRAEIRSAIQECRCDVLKKSLEKYEETHKHEQDIDDIIDILDLYGDYYGIMSDVDYFTNNETIFYDGYRDIDETHCFRLYYSGGNFIEFGTMRDRRFFTTAAELKIIGQGNSWDGIKIWEKYGFDCQFADDGKYIEKEHDYLYDSDIDYLLNDMSGQVVVRFTGQNGAFDYECTDEDKKALQNMAKYFKVKESILDIMMQTPVAD